MNGSDCLSAERTTVFDWVDVLNRSSSSKAAISNSRGSIALAFDQVKLGASVAAELKDGGEADGSCHARWPCR
jgi:hypothetical protein